MTKNDITADLVAESQAKYASVLANIEEETQKSKSEIVVLETKVAGLKNRVEQLSSDKARVMGLLSGLTEITGLAEKRFEGQPVKTEIAENVGKQ